MPERKIFCRHHFEKWLAQGQGTSKLPNLDMVWDIKHHVFGLDCEIIDCTKGATWAVNFGITRHNDLETYTVHKMKPAVIS